MWSEDTTSCFEINVCRLCANRSEVIIPIFGKEEDKERVDLKIKNFLPIILVEDDLKPKYVCFSCISKLEVCNELYELSLAADSKFETLLQSRRPGEKITDLATPEGTSNVHDASESTKQMSLLEAILPLRSWPEEMHSKHDNSVTSLSTSDEGGVIVLSKRDDKTTEGEGQMPQDIVFMVELKYKDDDENTLTKSHAVSYVVDPLETTESPKNPLSESTLEDRSAVFSLSYSKPSSLFCDSDLIKHPRVIYTETYLNDEAEDVVLKTSAGDLESELVYKRGEEEEEAGGSDKPFPCTLCSKAYMRRSTLKAHMGIHTQVRPHLCLQCGASFVLRWDLTLHLRIHNNDFACAFCNKAFSVKNKLERHLRVHTGERPFVCGTCGKAFGDKRNLASHQLTHSSDRPHVCPICGRTFRVPAHLREHRRVHSALAAFTCHVCGKNFKWKTNLNIHLKTHTGLRFPCEECGREFVRKSDLKKHQRGHSGDRPFVCGICNKSFSDKAFLQKHLKQHGQLKPFACDICGKTFHFQWYLTAHKKSHRVTKTYACDRCDKVFTKKGNLTIHARQHDSDPLVHLVPAESETCLGS